MVDAGPDQAEPPGQQQEVKRRLVQNGSRFRVPGSGYARPARRAGRLPRPGSRQPHPTARPEIFEMP